MSANEPTHRIGVEEEVFEAIAARNARMRPKWHFTLRAALLVAVIGVELLIVVLLATFVLFTLQENGGFYAAGFGVPGIETFLWSLPWAIIFLLVVVLIALGIFLRRHYSFAYQRSFFSLILVLIAAIALMSSIIPAVPLNSGIYHFAANDGLPWISGIYQHEITTVSGLYRGEVVSIDSTSTESFVLEGARGITSTLVVIPVASSELQGIGVGEYVLVYGRRVATNTVSASGVEPAGTL